jgi:hypothetical protein
VDGGDVMSNEKLDRAVIGVDGDCGFALLGENIQSGEAEFVKIENDEFRKSNPIQWDINANIASRRALARLRGRLGYTLESGKWLTYALHSSHPYSI